MSSLPPEVPRLALNGDRMTEAGRSVEAWGERFVAFRQITANALHPALRADGGPPQPAGRFNDEGVVTEYMSLGSSSAWAELGRFPRARSGRSESVRRVEGSFGEHGFGDWRLRTFADLRLSARSASTMLTLTGPHEPCRDLARQVRPEVRGS